MPDSDYLLAGLGGGLKGLIDAYKMKVERQQEDAKLRQSGLNQLSVMRPQPDQTLGFARLEEMMRHNKEMEGAAAKRAAEHEEPPTVETHGGVQYLVRRGRDGQKIYQQQKGSATSAEELAGNISSLERAPEFLAALGGMGAEGSVLGNIGRRVAQTPIIGGAASLVVPGVADIQQTQGAFITPYLQSGAGKAMTEGEKQTFLGRVKQLGLRGKKGSAQEGLRDLVSEILGKTESGIGSLAAGPESINLRAKLQKVIEANRKAGLLRGELPSPSFAPGPTLPPGADVEDLLETYGAP